MANTTNFNWETPDDTDLVKDGAAAIRTLGSAIDTSLVDLKGGTTGQILAKATNTDMDFSWITNDVGDITEVVASAPLTGGGTSGSITVGIQDATTAQKGAVQLENSTSSTSTTTAAVPASVKSAYDLANAAIPKSIVDAAGDLIYATANDTPARLAIGSTGNVLTVSGGVPTWAAPAGGGKVLQVVEGTKTGQASSSSNTYADIGLSVSITPSSSASKVLVFATCSSVTKYGGNTNVGFKLLRGSTSIFNTDAIATNNATGTNSIGTVSLVKLDSPATTSATTYKVQMANVDSAGTVAVNDYVSSNTNISTIIAMEIGA